MKAAQPPRPWPFLAWALAQVRAVAAQIGELLGLGVVLAIVRRRFCARACAAALTIMVLVAGACGTWLVDVDGVAAGAQAWLWCGGLVGMALAGFVAGRLSRGLAFWELYLATALLAAGMALHLGYGLEHLWPAASDPDSSALPWVWPASRGERLFGAMWSRLLGLGCILGFFVSVVGSSVAFLLYADGAGCDLRPSMAWWVARRHLRGRAGSSVGITAVVATCGIALGVAALVSVNAVMSGYQHDIQAKILATNAHLVVQKYGMDFTEHGALVRRLEGVAGVVAASPYTFNEAMLRGLHVSAGILVKGVDAESAGRVTDIVQNLCSTGGIDAEPGSTSGPGSAASTPRLGGGQASPLPCVRRVLPPPQSLTQALAPVDGVPTALVGAVLYRRLGQPLGSLVSITTPVGMAAAHGTQPRRMMFRLGGVFEAGMHEFDARLVYLTLSASQALMGMGEAANGVELRVARPDRTEALCGQLMRVLGGYPYRTLDWRELNQGIFTALKLQKIVMFLVLTFIVVVASFNIASTLFMAAVEKADEIAVLKAMGAKDGTIMKIFVFQGWVTGVVGTVLGVMLGLASAWALARMHLNIAADVYMVDALAVRVCATEVLWVALAALGIAHLATLYPALKAATTPPVDVMRGD